MIRISGESTIIAVLRLGAITLLSISLSACSTFQSDLLWGSTDDAQGSAAVAKVYRKGEVRAFAPVVGFKDGSNSQLTPDAQQQKARLLPLSRIQTVEVKRELEKLRSKRALRGLQITMKRAYPMMFQLAEVLEQEGLSSDMLIVPFIESNFRTKARSSRGAVGLWQFTRSTGRISGLSIGTFTDERKDPVKATRAAARHLRELYEEFYSWPLALAAYNSGTGRVQKACRPYKVCDYWKIARAGRLPKQTRNYVPKLLAHLIRLEELGLWPFVVE